MDDPVRVSPSVLSGAPEARVLWRRTFFVLLAGMALFVADRVTVVLATYWFFSSVGLESIFWTNFWTGAGLAVVGFVLFAAVVWLPSLSLALPRETDTTFRWGAVATGTVAALLLATRYVEVLPALSHVSFGEVDSIFQRDVGFYVFELPALWLAWKVSMWAAAAGVVASVLASFFAREGEPGPSHMSGAIRFFARLSRWPTVIAVAGLGSVAAWGVWLSRYGLLTRDNTASAIHNGAEVLDFTGLFSTLNHIHLATLGLLGVTGGVVFVLRTLGSGWTDAGDGWVFPTRKALIFVFLPVALDLAFWAGVGLRNLTGVLPNEPVVQLDLIQRHIDATLRGFDLEDVEVVRFEPAGQGDPLPDADALLASPTLRNAPLWPGFVSKLERLLDPQHAERILQTGDETVYGPVTEIFGQEQKLRTYYDFLDIDWVRYPAGDEPRMYVSAVREIPLIEPQEWLAWWGQRFVLFTHGHGLVMAEAGGVSPEGGPIYAASGLPVDSEIPSVGRANPRVYYGEGAATMAYSSVEGMQEFDYPTDEGRAEMELPQDIGAGVRLDSYLKRIVFGWRSRQFFEIVFSDLIDDETRVHYFRKPLARVARVAPFLYFDTDPYAVAADGRIMWIAAGLTRTDRYPYSKIEWLGDKSDERSPTPGELQPANWVRDAVRATVDAYSGELRFYALSDDPILRSWSAIYPDLFVPGDQMSEAVRAHLQYPLQLFHIQFDDVYKLYHMTDPMTFFNMEDAWDDGDEVLGAIVDKGKAITFSIEPYPWIAETGGVLPAAEPNLQYTLSMPFSPEGALNLRALAYAHQDGSAYGRLGVLQIPKGLYVPGPEQADAAIDQQPAISQQITWWNRLGADVIRGHTTAVIVGREVIYLEPIFIRSQQNPASQLKRVVAVIRGHAAMGETLEDAIRAALERAEDGPSLPRLAESADEDSDPDSAPGAEAVGGSDSGR